jgi:hypothetical protein
LTNIDAKHRALAEIALRAAGSDGLALAGGYAVRAHGIGDRPSGDVDLFTDWQRRADFPGAVQKVIAAYEDHGYTVTVVTTGETFARLLVGAPGAGEETPPDKVELAADWRAHPPVMLAIGPVLHPDDAVANKMCATLRPRPAQGLPRHRRRPRLRPIHGGAAAGVGCRRRWRL